MTARSAPLVEAGGPALVLRDVTVRYGDVTALEHADLELGRGRVCALVGMNGSGKSSLYRAVMGLVPVGPGGAVEVMGLPAATARRRGLVAYVPQREDIDWSFPLSVHDVVMTGRYGHMGPLRRARTADRSAVAAALDRVELTELARRPIGALSGGQRKRAFVARGIAQGATVLLLDEPFAGVDARSVATVTRLLRELADAGCTVLVATHDLHELPSLADEVVLVRGRPIMHDRPETVLRPEHLVRAFGLDPRGPGATA